jgi:hypothetical protein
MKVILISDHSGSQLVTDSPAKILRKVSKRTTILRYQSLIQVMTNSGIDPIGITARRMSTVTSVRAARKPAERLLAEALIGSPGGCRMVQVRHGFSRFDARRRLRRGFARCSRGHSKAL